MIYFKRAEFWHRTGYESHRVTLSGEEAVDRRHHFAIGGLPTIRCLDRQVKPRECKNEDCRFCRRVLSIVADHTLRLEAQRGPHDGNAFFPPFEPPAGHRYWRFHSRRIESTIRFFDRWRSSGGERTAGFSVPRFKMSEGWDPKVTYLT